MSHTVLITGASGALGPHLIAALLRSKDTEHLFVMMRPHRRSLDDRARDLMTAAARVAADYGDPHPIGLERVRFIVGDIGEADLGLAGATVGILTRAVDAIVHAAATTCFTTPIEQMRAVNVDGTRHVLALAERCRSLRQFLFVSTTCVAGTRTGSIPERLEDAPPDFVNAYERTKWEAEQLTAAASLPVRIARLSTCLGGQHTGYVHRFGAIHHSLHWMMRGLIPMVPGAPESRLDVITNEVAANWIARALLQPVEHLDVCHVAAGSQAIPLDEVLSTAFRCFAARRPARGRDVGPPLVVDRETFALFERSVAQSGDLLFAGVLESTRPFLPALLYPKIYLTDRAARCWGGPLVRPDWRTTIEHVIDFGCAQQWRDARREEPAHV